MAKQQITPLPPKMNNQIKGDIKAYEEALLRLKMDKQMIAKLLKMVKTMKNPLLGAQELMLALMGYNGDKVAAFSDVANIDSDIRSMITGGQGAFNNTLDSKTAEFSSKIKQFIKEIDGLEAFLKYEKALGKKSPLDGSTLNTMLNAIKSVKTAFGTNWGNVKNMEADIKIWTNPKNRTTYPALRSIQDAFHTLTQSASALSTTANTQLQYETEQYKQFMGETEGTMQSYLKAIQASIQNQRSS